MNNDLTMNVNIQIDWIPALKEKIQSSSVGGPTDILFQLYSPKDFINMVLTGTAWDDDPGLWSIENICYDISQRYSSNRGWEPDDERADIYVESILPLITDLVALVIGHVEISLNAYQFSFRNASVLGWTSYTGIAFKIYPETTCLDI